MTDLWITTSTTNKLRKWFQHAHRHLETSWRENRCFIGVMIDETWHCCLQETYHLCQDCCRRQLKSGVCWEPKSSRWDSKHHCWRKQNLLERQQISYNMWYFYGPIVPEVNYSIILFYEKLDGIGSDVAALMTGVRNGVYLRLKQIYHSIGVCIIHVIIY